MIDSPLPVPAMDAHVPVLLNEVVEALRGARRVIDGTLGAGGHTRALLDASADEVLAFDLDSQAIATARAALAAYGSRVHIVQDSYLTMGTHAAALFPTGVDGIVLDLGISSMQVDTPERGFSFRHDAPLDMRFDPHTARATAADLVNTLSEDALADLFYRYGEEPQGRRLARAIVRARPLSTTGALAAVLEKAAPRRPGERAPHPATRVFQALRIAVNGELEAVAAVLPLAIDLLTPGGRLAVISFHSLEDRLVKDAFRLASTDCICPPKIPVCVCGHRASVALVNRKPIVATDAETAANPRSRSAKLRVVEKLGDDADV